MHLPPGLLVFFEHLHRMAQLAVGRLQRAARALQLPAHGAQAHAVIHGREQRVLIHHRGGKEVVGAETQSAHHAGGGGLVREHDHRHLHVQFAQAQAVFGPGGGSGVHIAENDIPVAGVVQRGLGIVDSAGKRGAETGGGGQTGEFAAAVGIVIDNQHFAAVGHLNYFIGTLRIPYADAVGRATEPRDFAKNFTDSRGLASLHRGLGLGRESVKTLLPIHCRKQRNRRRLRRR